MTTLAAYAKPFAPSFTLRPGARIAALIEALQHQGTLKRAAYTHMPALVELETCNVVNVPGLIRLHVRTIDARRGATIDGEPTIVPRRRIIAFDFASELKEALESKRLP